MFFSIQQLLNVPVTSFEDQNYNTWAKRMISAVVVLHPPSFFVNSSSECYTVKHIYRPQGSAARTDNLVFSPTHPFTWETRYFTAQDEVKFSTMYTGRAICAETEPWVFDPDLATDKFKMTLWHPTSYEGVIRQCFCVCDNTLFKVPFQVPSLKIWKGCIFVSCKLLYMGCIRWAA